MANRTKAKLTSGSGSVLAAIWAGYSRLTTASDLPEDAGSFVKMLTDPPVYIPWLILAMCVLVLAWSMWPKSKEPDDDEEGEAPPPSGPVNPTQFHSGSGDNTMNF